MAQNSNARVTLVRRPFTAQVAYLLVSKNRIALLGIENRQIKRQQNEALANIIYVHFHHRIRQRST
jgi:hypothetical protein